MDGGCGGAGHCPAPVIASRAKQSKPSISVQTPIPSVEGCPRRGGVVSPRRSGRNLRPNLRF
ncbi:MAG: hypothetical protein LBM98_00795 [Oscillospiraceae bacterium]|nr:hypothetical protein [Oscillospiraceae bacterium]